MNDTPEKADSVLVTGGAGFIGRHLVRALLAEGRHVRVFDNLQRARADDLPRDPNVELVTGDLRDADAVRRAMRGVRRVYHLGAQSNVLGAASNIEYSFQTNVVGTFYVLRAAVKAGVERVVFTSSREVYGEVDLLPVPETRPLVPKNAYGASKMAGEAYCAAARGQDGLDVNVLRLANVYGPGDTQRVIPLWLELATQGKPLQLYGGEQVLDFVPTATVVEALLRAGEQSLGDQAVNVGSGQGTTLRTLAEHIQELVGDTVDMQTHPARSLEVVRFVADTTRMRALLGIEQPADPLVALPDVLAEIRSRAVPEA